MGCHHTLICKKIPYIKIRIPLIYESICDG
jgi:hypothetical protein